MVRSARRCCARSGTMSEVIPETGADGQGKKSFSKLFFLYYSGGHFASGYWLWDERSCLGLAIGSRSGVGLEGRWAGRVSPTGPNCGASFTGLMSVSRDKFAFDPFQSTAIIHGSVVERRLTGRLERIGGEHRVSIIELEAEAKTGSDGSRFIQGELKSGSCRWRVELHPG